MNNTYSDTWFDVFLRPIAGDATEMEVAFVARHLPQPQYRTIIDLCCGDGRHAHLLAKAGYEITAVDNNRNMIEEAVARGSQGIKYKMLDMRRLSELPGRFDAIINLWQSFGYFDEDENSDILRAIRSKLSPFGRLILDVYHRAFFEQHQGTRQAEMRGVAVREEKQITGDRLSVRLTYIETGETDTFDWRVYYPEELVRGVEGLGFRCITTCTDFDETKRTTPERPRMQLVFENIG